MICCYFYPAATSSGGILFFLLLVALCSINWDGFWIVIAALSFFGLALILDFAAVARMEASHSAKRAAALVPVFALSVNFYARGARTIGTVFLVAFIILSIVCSLVSISPLHEEARKDESDAFLPLEMILVAGIFIASYLILEKALWIDSNIAFLISFLILQFAVIILNIVLRHTMSDCMALEASLFIAMFSILYYFACKDANELSWVCKKVVISPNEFFKYVNHEFSLADMFDSTCYTAPFYLLNTDIEIPLKYAKWSGIFTLAAFFMITAVPILVTGGRNSARKRYWL